MARLISAMELPTPKLLGEIKLDNRYGLIYERVMGKSLLTMLCVRLWLCVQYGQKFAELHAAIHRQQGLELPPLKASLKDTIRGLQEMPTNLLEPVLNRLAGLPEGDKLYHLDFHPDQAMVTDSGLSVLDWMTAHCGPPAADVALYSALSRIIYPCSVHP